MVGSIAFSKKEGDHVKKGDEVLDVLIYYCSVEVWYLGFLILLSFHWTVWILLIRWKHSYLRF